MAEPDEALIEAIAEATWLDDVMFDGLTLETAQAEFPWPPAEDLADAYRSSATVAYAAMVEHLGLVEESHTTPASFEGPTNIPKPGVTHTRLVTPWVEAAK